MITHITNIRLGMDFVKTKDHLKFLVTVFHGMIKGENSKGES